MLLAATFLTIHSQSCNPQYTAICINAANCHFCILKTKHFFFTAYSDVFLLFGSRNFAGTVECLFMFNYVLCVSKLKESYKHPVQVRKKGPSDVLCEQIFTVQPCRHVQKNFQPTLPLQMETCKNPFPFHFMFSSCVF